MRREGVKDPRGEFVAFYETNKDACLRTVTVSVGDPHLAEELVTEAFARAWAAWAKVSEHGAPAAWVVRVALNTRVSWWRRRRREMPLTGHDSVQEDVSAGLDRDIAAALARLPARQREVVALRLLLDLDTDTTAHALGIAPGTVTAHLARAMRALRQHMLTNDPERISEVTQ
jgi:RNA polymerase sigma-70 factor (sigma-E family)